MLWHTRYFVGSLGKCKRVKIKKGFHGNIFQENRACGELRCDCVMRKVCMHKIKPSCRIFFTYGYHFLYTFLMFVLCTVTPNWSLWLFAHTLSSKKRSTNVPMKYSFYTYSKVHHSTQHLLLFTTIRCQQHHVNWDTKNTLKVNHLDMMLQQSWYITIIITLLDIHPWAWLKVVQLT